MNPAEFDVQQKGENKKCFGLYITYFVVGFWEQLLLCLCLYRCPSMSRNMNNAFGCCVTGERRKRWKTLWTWLSYFYLSFLCVLFASPPTHIFFHIYMYIPTVYYDVDDDAFIRYYCIGQRPVSLFRRRHSLTTDNMCINKENEKLYGARVNNTREKV